MKFLTGLLLVLLIAGGLLVYIFLAPYGPSTETFVDIPAHSGTPRIAAQLKQTGMIRSRYAFELLRLIKGGTLHPGEYRFDHKAPLAQVYARIARGDIYTRALVIPEGYNIFDIAQAVEKAGLGSRADFLAAERQHTELIADLAPHATSLEGYLFPATYSFSPHAAPVQMLTAMVHRFRQAAAKLGLQDNVARTVIMASLIEKEVSQDTERPIVAGVFQNRLVKNMALETDPAVVYAALLEDRYRGTIYLSDLRSPSPYNTYKHPGLPPGPICNPGIAAFQAALHPTQTDFIYFVSDAAGHTRFSVDLKEHEQQVAAYREAIHAGGQR
ncbi:endolytic transglycosylase MltG [Granulicella arctica]|uniref:endolytic transglycosylase MltG n=1 Tax=Granulicella arctica TaxID=940613 RepID=UPI0021DFDE3F|nr:endolytic transglycosylase MltG [Granulicella arctica]